MGHITVVTREEGDRSWSQLGQCVTETSCHILRDMMCDTEAGQHQTFYKINIHCSIIISGAEVMRRQERLSAAESGAIKCPCNLQSPVISPAQQPPTLHQVTVQVFTGCDGGGLYQQL